MFIYIGIGLLVLSLVSLYLIMAVVRVQKATYAVIDEWGTKPVDILPPGWHWIRWPKHSLHERLSVAVVTANLKEIQVTCRVENGSAKAAAKTTRPSGINGSAKAAAKTAHPYGIADLTAAVISLNWQLSFTKDKGSISKRAKRTKELESLFRLITKKDGKWDYTRLDELLRDMVEELFRNEVKDETIYDARNPSADKIKRIKDELETRFAALNLPIDVLQLAVNQPFAPTDEAVKKALMDRGKSRLEAEDLVVAAQGQIEVAKKTAKKTVVEANARLAVAKVDAEATQVSAAALAAAYGFDKLPDPEKAKAFLSVRALEVYKEIGTSPSTKMVIGSDLLTQITNMLGALTKGGKA